ncbi:MAG: hypothetical protein ACYDCA_01465 [Candidatus Tyrphobacter sp.]
MKILCESFRERRRSKVLAEAMNALERAWEMAADILQVDWVAG